MKESMRIVIIFGIIIVVLSAYLVLHKRTGILKQAIPKRNTDVSTGKQNTSSNTPTDKIRVIAQDLDTPWAIAFLPDGSVLFTERPGRVRRIDSSGNLQETSVIILSQVREIGEGGLLGIALHPDFTANHLVYFYYTYSGNGENTLNRVVRMTWNDNRLGQEQIIVDQIPGASNHNGGRIKFGPDKNLYITTGDAENPSQAQNTATLGGKILRTTDEGKPLPDNPFNNLVYSYGHRNPQGIAWDSQGNLWETEHGPSGGILGTGNDEINSIEKGQNYGWPRIQGNQSQLNMVTPVLNSTPKISWAPSGAAIIGNTLYFSGLRGQSLYEAKIENKKIVHLTEHFKGEFGRIREVILGPDKMLYITTSNKDGRGSPIQSDDRIIRIDPNNL